jgi:hypothetical protein
MPMLASNPTYLCARVLHGHYFLDGDFWNAPCPRSASYTWNSVLHGRYLVEKGILWGIGNGSIRRLCMTDGFLGLLHAWLNL